MDGAAVLETIHKLDPGFRDICAALYPGLDPREVYGVVYKGNPDTSDLHVPSTKWRNGRGDTKGRGRRKIDVDVKRVVHKADRKKLEHGIGLGTTAVGAGISTIALPKHLREIPHAINAAKTGPSVSQGVKESVKAVRQFSRPTQGVLPGMKRVGGLKSVGRAGGEGLKTAGGALKAGARVAGRNPKIAAAGVLGAAGLHTANLGGEAIATHVLAGGQKPKKPKMAINKAMDEIVEAYRAGKVSKATAMRLGEEVVKGFTLDQQSTKLQTLKAPSVEMPKVSGRVRPVKQTPKSVQVPKGKGAPKGKTGSSGKAGVKKSDELTFDAEVEFAKVDADLQQVFGWCSVVKINGEDVVDKQDDQIDISEIEKAAYDYVLGSRAGGDMHRRAADGGVHKVADMIESFVLTPEKIEKMGLPDTVPQGWWIGMQVHDEQAWADVKNGKRKGFSIHGRGHREEIEIDD